MRRAGPSELEGRTVDLLVIGGGITGAAAARDAALRGLDVALLEADDFAAGTSSRSTKLLHGGLRYLKQRAFAMVRESCRERELMGVLAPHLARPRSFFYLLYPEDPEPRWQLGVGLRLYDLFSGNPPQRRNHMVTAEQILAAEPHLRREGLRGGGKLHDFITDDARLTVDTVKSAVDAGAQVANHTAVEGLLTDASGRITGVTARDALADEAFEVRARVVVNAAGPWVDAVRRQRDPATLPMLRPTKGVHLVVSRSDFPIWHALFFRHPRDGRSVWPIPAIDPDLVYVGTTDTDYDGPLDDVAADDADVDYLLEAANHIVPEARLDRSHVRGTWAGLRPLVASDPDAAASDVSREHVITTDDDGLVTIAGGKLSTARAMAEELVDVVAEQLRERHGLPTPGPCRTAEVPLAGGDAAGWQRARRRSHEAGLAPPDAFRIVDRYGSEAERVLDLLGDEPALAAAAHPGITRAECAFACRREQARTVTDVLVRRTSTFFWSPDGGAGAAEAVAGVMAEELGWSAAERQRQVGDYLAWRQRNGYRLA
ncbi:MAG: glycerol-3-phosphate dehydrogenase/oxidase [Egibacteraceae bacterium]